MRKYTVILFLIIAGYTVSAQERDKKPYVQVDGIVFDEEGDPIKYVNIISRNLRLGTDSDENGIFSIISVPGDTLLFTAIGYKAGLFIMPEDIDYPRYSIDIEMLMDTINIGSVLVLPWKTYGEFVNAVIDYSPPEEEMIKAMEYNLALIERQIYDNMRVSPEMGYRYAMNQEVNRVMTANQTPVNNLLNPFAWSKFIDGLKNGLLKNKKSDKKKKKKDKDQENN
jgi:hypothetical protein